VIPQFTLEYPHSFESVGISPHYDENSFFIYFPRSDPTEQIDEHIYVDVQTTDFEPYFPFDFTLPDIVIPTDLLYGGSPSIFTYDIITKKSYFPGHRHSDVLLLEDKKVKISGVSGRYAAYSYNWRPYLEKAYTVEVILRRVSFNHSDYVWILSMESYAENSEETEAYFNHLMKTFRVLD